MNPTRKANVFYRFKKVTTPSLLRQKPDPETNKNLKMGKMNPFAGSTSKSVIMAGGKKRPVEKDNSKSSPFKGASPAGSCNGSGVQDIPDFTVLDVKQEEFEQVEKTNIVEESKVRKEVFADFFLQVGDEVKEIEGDPLTTALDRRKQESSGQVRPRGHNLGLSPKEMMSRRKESEES